MYFRWIVFVLLFSKSVLSPHVVLASENVSKKYFITAKDMEIEAAPVLFAGASLLMMAHTAYLNSRFGIKYAISGAVVALAASAIASLGFQFNARVDDYFYQSKIIDKVKKIEESCSSEGEKKVPKYYCSLNHEEKMESVSKRYRKFDSNLMYASSFVAFGFVAVIYASALFQRIYMTSDRCIICLEPFTEERQRSLPFPSCGHANICEACIETYQDQAYGNLCPECKSEIQFADYHAMDFPLAYAGRD